MPRLERVGNEGKKHTVSLQPRLKTTASQPSKHVGVVHSAVLEKTLGCGDPVPGAAHAKHLDLLAFERSLNCRVIQPVDNAQSFTDVTA